MSSPEKVVVLGSSFPSFQIADSLHSLGFQVRVVDDEKRSCNDNCFAPFIKLDKWSVSSLCGCLSDVQTVVLVVPFEPPLTHIPHQQAVRNEENIVRRVEYAVGACLSSRISRFLYVGDAYSSLPLDDNYGISEQKHKAFPSSFLLGSHGEALCRAEHVARHELAGDAKICSLFLRPVMCPSSPWFQQLINMGHEGILPFIPGKRRSMHQFIQLHNLVNVISKAIVRMRSHASQCSGEIVYCVDDTRVVSIHQIIHENSAAFSSQRASSFLSEFAIHLHGHILYRTFGISCNLLPFHTFRFIFEKTIGFSNRKQRLLMDFKPTASSTPQIIAKMNKTTPLRQG